MSTTSPLRRARVIVDREGNDTSIIITIFEENRICFGSQYDYCVDLQLYHDNNGQLVEGIFTKLSFTDTWILLFVLTYVHDHYPTVKVIYYTDFTQRSMFDVMLDGVTWYESHFDVAIPHREPYDAVMRYMADRKQKLSAADFLSHVPSCSISRDQLARMYENSSTWQEFFTAAKDELGMGAFCHWLSTDAWFERFVRHHLMFAPEIISFHFTPQRFPLTYEIVSMRGGGIRTRRRRRTAMREI